MVLRNRQFHNLKFRRQYSVGRFILDFYCPKLRLAIEIDGQSHFRPGRKQHDARRQQWLESHRIQVIRFLSSDVLENLDGLVQALDQAVQSRGVSLGRTNSLQS